MVMSSGPEGTVFRGIMPGVPGLKYTEACTKFMYLEVYYFLYVGGGTKIFKTAFDWFNLKAWQKSLVGRQGR